VKRLDYDEWHRTQGSPQVRAQAELDVREGRKHNIQLGFSSQRLRDMGDGIVSQSTGRFVLRAGDDKEAEEIIERFNLSEASADIVRYRLHGPGPAGAPFLAVLQVDNAKYEQMLVNTLGPIELWPCPQLPAIPAAQSALREAWSDEALRRLAKIFPSGSALREIERRKSERLRRGEIDARLKRAWSTSWQASSPMRMALARGSCMMTTGSPCRSRRNRTPIPERASAPAGTPRRVRSDRVALGKISMPPSRYRELRRP